MKCPAAAIPRSPSVLSLAVAWAMALASEIGWSVALYDYDGEMGVTPPPSIWATAMVGAVVATALIALAWVGWRSLGSVTGRYWVFLIGAFAAKGLLFAGLEELFVLLYGAAPFSLAGSYRSAALSVSTALVSGLVVALTVRAIDASRQAVIDPVATHFE